MDSRAGLRFDTIENVRILPPILVLKAKQLAKAKALEKWISNVPVRSAVLFFFIFSVLAFFFFFVRI
jgi:hypothetical protein